MRTVIVLSAKGFVNSEGSCAEGNTENQRKIANWERRRLVSEPGQRHFGTFLDLEAEHVRSKTWSFVVRRRCSWRGSIVIF